jgi:sulfatase modifying factor 1
MRTLSARLLSFCVGLVLLGACLGLGGCGARAPDALERATSPGDEDRGQSVEEAPWARLSSEQVEEARFLGVPAAFENAVGMRFVYVPAGTFDMGSPPGEPGRAAGEEQHPVTLTLGYYLQVSPVTLRQLGRGESDEAATGVSFDEAVAFAAALSAQDPAWSYRLPTEAEWERACRAGSTSAYPWGPDAASPTLPAARNPWGLTGMTRGLREWCRDRFAPLPSWPMGDPLGPHEPEGSGHVVRGGGSSATPARSAKRGQAAADTRAADLGFRLVVPVGYGLGAYGSVAVTFRLTDEEGPPGGALPDAHYDLRVIKMNDRLSARMAGVETPWRRIPHPTMPITLRMVPGKYYVYAEASRGGSLARGREIKFHAWGRRVDVPVPVPERDLSRYGSGADEKPQ